MAEYLSLGVNHVYIQHYFPTNQLTAVLPLGLAARGVRKRIEPIWEQVQNDAAGQGNVEATFQGMSGVISFDVSIHDADTLERCKLPLPNLTQVEGYIPAGGIGTFLYKSRNYFRILLYRPYAEAQGQEPFINFPMCRLGNLEEMEGGSEKRSQLVWIVHTPMQYCSAGDAVFYNNDGSGWPGAISCTMQD